jgi:hypothetical protein
LATREEIDHRLARIDAAIANLAVVLDDEPFEGGLAEAIRTVLKRKPGQWMMPTQVRNGLKEIGYDINQHTNIMASVHSVLKRLAETPDVQGVKGGGDSGVLFRWKTGTAVAPKPTGLASLNEAMRALAEHAKVIDVQKLGQEANASMLKLSDVVANLKAAGLLK